MGSSASFFSVRDKCMRFTQNYVTNVSLWIVFEFFLNWHDFIRPTAVFGCRQRCYIKKFIFHVTIHNTCNHRALLNYQWWAVVLEIHNWSWLASEKPCDISQKLQLYTHSEILKDDSSCTSVSMLTRLNLKIKSSCYYGILHLMRVIVL